LTTAIDFLGRISHERRSRVKTRCVIDLALGTDVSTSA